MSDDWTADRELLGEGIGKAVGGFVGMSRPLLKAVVLTVEQADAVVVNGAVGLGEAAGDSLQVCVVLPCFHCFAHVMINVIKTNVCHAPVVLLPAGVLQPQVQRITGGWWWRGARGDEEG